VLTLWSSTGIHSPCAKSNGMPMTETWTILKLLEWSTQYFRDKKIESARLDAELLLGHILGLSRVQLYTQFDRLLNSEELQRYKILFKRRSEREPLAYLLGKKEFFSMEFEVSPDVLIPRPETELLVEEAIQYAMKSQTGSADLHILDLGTGSGCIAIALAKKFSQASITALDISEAALTWAQKNAKKHGVEKQIRFIKTDFLEFLPESALYDLILSNPPYIATLEIPNLAPELRFEPNAALDGGADGLQFYRKLLPWAFKNLQKKGQAYFEMGDKQAKALEELATNTGFQKISILKDYAGNPRVLSLSNKPS